MFPFDGGRRRNAGGVPRWPTPAERSPCGYSGGDAGVNKNPSSASERCKVAIPRASLDKTVRGLARMQHHRKPQANAPETTVPPGATHVVTNQPPPLEGYDLFSVDPVLGDALERAGAGWARERAIALGTLLGGAPLEWGRLANV